MDLLVKIDHIKDRGLSVDRELGRGDLAELLRVDPPTSYEPETAADLEARLTKVNGGDILFEGRVDLQLGGECRRCLGRAEATVPVSFKLDLVRQSVAKDELDLPPLPVEDDGMGEIAGTFSPDDANQVFYTGHEIDLAPIIREQILLALPLTVLCDPDCKGLCQVCGKNLNVEECGCDRHVPDPRWAGLKKIKL